MTVWQMLLGCILGVAAGIVLGLVGFVLHAHVVKKDAFSLRAAFLTLLGTRPKLALVSSAAGTQQGESAAPVLVRVMPSPVPVSIMLSAAPRTGAASLAHARMTAPQPPPSHPTPATTPEPLEALFAFDQPIKEFVLRLLGEFDRNRRVARDLEGDNLVPMRTDAWERSQRFLRTLPGEVRSDLESIYADIRLLNNLVWLCTEFDRRGPTVREQYANLATSIAGRLDDLIRRSLSPFADREGPFGVSADVLRQSVATG